MPRAALTIVLGLGLAGFGIYSFIAAYVFQVDRPLRAECFDWLDKPGPRWVELRNCTLDTQQMVLENEQGELEALVTRVDGRSTHLYDKPPVWVAAWAPVRDDMSRSGLVRAAVRLESADLIKWLNALDRAPKTQREAMWNDPAPLRRVIKPGVLLGRAEKPPTDALQKTWGSLAASSLLIVTPGVPPETQAPVLGILALVIGGAMLFVGARLAVGASGGPLGVVTAEQMITNVNVSDVRVELGALEQLRAEEREARRSAERDDR